MKKLSIVVLTSFLIYACSAPESSDPRALEEADETPADAMVMPSKEESGDSLEFVSNQDIAGFVEQFYRSKSDNAKQGLYRKLTSGGVLLEEASYVNDTIHGIRIQYYEKGDTQIIETFDMGTFNGPFKAYYENGNLELLGHYDNNVMKGKWYKYYESGELEEIVTFDHNAENGPFVEFYRNGNKKAEGNYVNGENEDGLLLLYDETGTLVKKMDCDKGICKTIWRFGQDI